MAPKFFMMVGIPGSGKSTAANKIAEKCGAVIISSDAIRGELYGDEAIQGDHSYVFQLMEERTLAALKAGRSVIYDATNVIAWRRREFLTKLPQGVEKACILVDVTLERAFQNNQERERHVPEWVIRDQAERLEPPTVAEGWDCVRTVAY